MTIDLPTLIVWLIIGALSGSAASNIMRGGSGRGRFLINTIIGLIGAVIGGFLFQLFRIQIPALLAIQINAQQLLAAFVGAIILIFLVRVLRRA